MSVKRATVRENDLLGDVKTETEIPGCRLFTLSRSAEGLKDEREYIRGNGMSLVADLYDNFRSVGACIDDHGCSRRGVLDGVPREVGEKFRQPIRIPDSRDVAFNIQLDGRLEFLDDASADESIAVAERALQGTGINWRVVRNERNSGNVFAQWRKGAELASSDLVWIAEADDWADSRFLESAAKAFQRSDIVLSMTQSQQANGDGAITARDYLDYLTDVSPTKWLSPFVGEGSAEVRAGLAIKNTIPNVSAVLFKRSVLVDVLRQHERDIGSYRVAGDWCVYVNMLRHGALAFTPEALNIHRRHSQGVTIAKFGLQDLAEIARMQAYVAREFEPGPEAARRARAYLEQLVQQFGLDKRCPPAQIEGAMRGVVAA